MHGMRRLCAISIVMIPLAGGCAKGDVHHAATTARSGQPHPVSTSKRHASTTGSAGAHAVQPADAALAKLDLDEQAGQLVMTLLRGPRLSDADRRTIRGQHLGGVIVFDDAWSGPAGMRALVAGAQAAARAGNGAGAGLLVATDQEPGANRELTSIAPAQSPAELAANGASEARAAGERTARELRAVGIDMDLAPVADLDEAPARVMRGRAFAADPAEAATAVEAFVRGIHDGGGSAVAKHFPGFGGATVNSDLGLARNARGRAQLLADDLQPFRAASRAKVDAIMVSHGLYAAIDPQRPASLSPAVVQGLLRDEVGYDGVAMTDSLNAKGVREATHGSVPEACADAVAAGIDIVLVTGTMETARICRRHIVDAVRDGAIPRSRVEEAATRVLRLKARLGLLPPA
jgi:beta-N-acetylhexosaminidase